MILADQLRAAEIDLANTMRARAVLSAEPRLSSDEDRALELQLRNSIRLVAGRVRAGLPPRARPNDVATWHAWLNYRFWMARYGRRHPHHPINRALVAH